MTQGFELVLQDDGDYQLWLDDRSDGSHGPPVSVAWHEDRIGVVLIGRLVDRAELAQKLPEHLRRGWQTDADLVLRFYRDGGGDNLPRRLDGEYSLVILDRRQGRMLALRDPLGNWPLYWSQGRSQVRIGTSMARLARWAEGEVDRGYCAEFLMAPAPLAELPTVRTPYEGVSRVQPGELIEARPRGVHRRPWWDWPTIVGSVAIRSVREGYDIWQHRLEQAVDERLAWGQAALCSTPGPAGDVLRDVAGKRSGHGLPPSISVGETLPQRQLQPPRMQEPAFQWFLMEREARLIDQARHGGATVLMSDRGGDMLIRPQTSNCFSMLLQATLGRLQPVADRWMRSFGRAKNAIPAWIRSDFARSEDLSGIAAQHGKSLLGPSSAWLWHVRNSVGDAVSWNLAAPRGVWLTHPFRDVQLTAFGLGLAAACPNQQQKQLGELARRSRISVCEWMEPARRMLARHGQQIRHWSESPLVADQGIIEPAALSLAIEAAIAGRLQARGMHQLLSTLGLVSWLHSKTAVERIAA
jgi:hypothetical protein